jgi:Mrp family chromosome partitioning ATPase
MTTHPPNDARDRSRERSHPRSRHGRAAGATRHSGILVCCGAGGVGKTTTAAALGLCAPPRAGVGSVVLTIDPARRLAQSLGLTELDNTPRPSQVSTPRPAVRSTR